MDTLREALDFISDFVPLSSINYPLLKVGLERENIEQQVSVLPFKLSEEVYELYQWSNGAFLGNLPYPKKSNWSIHYQPIFNILSLERAIEIARSWGNGSFPLTEEESAYICFTVGNREQQRTAPIFCSDESCDRHNQTPCFESLTSMMIQLVEAVNYQTNLLKNRTVYSDDP
ncbi:MAG: hypothetical protein F6K32_05590 [Desertifilum sp. SIO1I2]|nr:hypothetical protein [Desertifilum sp. SIO1I2]